MLKSAQVFSIYSTIVYYGGDLILPIIILFLIYVGWAIAISRRLDIRVFDKWADVRGNAADRKMESGIDPDYKAFIENLHLDKSSRQINILVWYLCIFPILGFLGTLLGAAKISIGTSTGSGFLHEISILHGINATLVPDSKA